MQVFSYAFREARLQSGPWNAVSAGNSQQPRLVPAALENAQVGGVQCMGHIDIGGSALDSDLELVFHPHGDIATGKRLKTGFAAELLPELLGSSQELAVVAGDGGRQEDGHRSLFLAGRVASFVARQGTWGLFDSDYDPVSFRLDANPFRRLCPATAYIRIPRIVRNGTFLHSRRTASGRCRPR